MPGIKNTEYPLILKKKNLISSFLKHKKCCLRAYIQPNPKVFHVCFQKKNKIIFLSCVKKYKMKS